MDEQKFLGWAILFATFFGPVFAVFVTRWVDESRSRRGRKLHTFTTLMRTRRSQLNADFVQGLNMVELDFYRSTKVLAAHAELMKLLNNASETTITVGEWNERVRRAVARLLYFMGKEVGYSMEQLDILEGGYLPQGIVAEEEDQQRLRQALLSVLSGAQPLSIGIAAPLHNVPAPQQAPVPVSQSTPVG
jgi:hypothetical protein